MREITKVAVIIIASLTAIFATGCSTLKTQPDPDSNLRTHAKEEGSSSVIKSPGSDPKGELEIVAKNFAAIGSFHSRSTTMSERPLTMDVDYLKPDRYHVTMQPDEEWIVIGKVAYLKKGNKWTTLPDEGESRIPGVRDIFSDEALRGISDIQFLGEESPDGETLLRYTYAGASVGSEHLQSEMKLWVFKQTNLPAKIVIDYHSESAAVSEIVYSYPRNIRIEIPK
jgi:hypothetical protein